jgi:hypothetical protein
LELSRERNALSIAARVLLVRAAMDTDLMREREIEDELPSRPWGEMAVVAIFDDGDEDENTPDDDEPETLREPPSSGEISTEGAPSERMTGA